MWYVAVAIQSRATLSPFHPPPPAVSGAFRHADCYAASVDDINRLMEDNEMRIDFTEDSKTMYLKLVDENGDPRDFSTESHVFQWKWDALGDYMGPCGRFICFRLIHLVCSDGEQMHSSHIVLLIFFYSFRRPRLSKYQLPLVLHQIVQLRC